MNKKETLHKILNDELSLEEENSLLNSSSVIGRMHEQWKRSANLPYANSVNGERTFALLTNALWKTKHISVLRYYKVYSIAASILLLFTIGGMSWLYQKTTEQPDEMYVLVCGRQTVDSVTLPDGTNVLISSGSRLTYPKAFKGDSRQVELSGQAFFEVAKDKKKPFIVKTAQMEVMALGTAFEVFSFDKGENKETVLLNGKVKVTMVELPGVRSPEYILNPNQKLFVAKNGKVCVESVDANKYSAWRSKGCLSFENEKLAMIIPRLESWFKKKIICDKHLAEMNRFSFTIDDETCSDVLRMLSKTSSLTFREKEGVYLIIKK
ncbi:MAG: FecR domain-containing protein [Bacteroides sp.]